MKKKMNNKEIKELEELGLIMKKTIEECDQWLRDFKQRRDMFAAHALQGILSASNQGQWQFEPGTEKHLWIPENAARCAVFYADKLIEELNRK